MPRTHLPPQELGCTISWSPVSHLFSCICFSLEYVIISCQQSCSCKNHGNLTINLIRSEKNLTPNEQKAKKNPDMQITAAARMDLLMEFNCTNG